MSARKLKVATARKTAARAPTQSIQQRIEMERRQLQRATAVLACLALAFDQELEVDFGDVANVAKNLILDALRALDVIALDTLP